MLTPANREFTFLADAKEVHNFLIGSTNEDVRKIEMTDGEYFFQFYFLLKPQTSLDAPNAVYSGKAWVNMCKGNRRNAAQLRYEDWLLAEAEICQIVISQSTERESKVSLHLNNWAQQLLLDKVDAWTANVCFQFLSEWWSGMMRDWNEKHSTHNQLNSEEASTSASQVSDATPSNQRTNDLDEFTPPPEPIGQKYYDSYNPQLAKQIGDAFPQAWAQCQREDNRQPIARFTLTLIAEQVPTTVETVSRYIALFRKVGISQIHRIALPKEQNRQRRSKRGKRRIYQ